MNAVLQTPPPPPAPAPEPQPLSEGARLVDTFIAPAKTFTDLRRNASWWAPFALMAIVSVLFVWVVDRNIGFQKVTENNIQMSPKAAERLERMPADQRAQAMDRQEKVTRYISYGFFLFILIWNVIIAAILLATFKFGASADVNFKTSLAIVMYASLPSVLKSLLGIISVAAGASADSFTFQNPVATNPGYFLNPADGRFLYSIASSLDIIMIWILALTAIGFSSVSKVKRSTAMTIVFGWYVVFTLMSASLGALFS
jgi:Yip1 domain